MERSTAGGTGQSRSVGRGVNAGSRFWISAVDVRDAFHRMALPDNLSDFFLLPGGTAREFNVHELNGERSPLVMTDYLWPCCQRLPMCFSWAVCLAQQATTAAEEATCIAESELQHDRQANLSLEQGTRDFVCMDNIGLIGEDCVEVERLMDRVSWEL